jgi:hypothetical protein
MLRIIAEECCNNKTNILFCYVEFRKVFDIVPRTNLWNRLEELKVHSELRVVATQLYETVIDKFRSTKEWLEQIDSNIRVKQACPLYPTLFDIYIDKFEDCFDVAG